MYKVTVWCGRTLHHYNTVTISRVQMSSCTMTPNKPGLTDTETKKIDTYVLKPNNIKLMKLWNEHIITCKLINLAGTVRHNNSFSLLFFSKEFLWNNLSIVYLW